MENHQIKILNQFVSQQILNVLTPLKQHLNESVELINQSNSPTLTSSIVSFLNNLSVDSVIAIDRLIIEPGLGEVNCNSTTLFKYYAFNSSFSGKFQPVYDNAKPKDNIKKIDYQLLYLDEFIETTHVASCDNKYKLIPHMYCVNDSSSDVLENLLIIIAIIDRVILNYV